MAQAMLVFDVGGENDRTVYLDETEYRLTEQAEGTFAYLESGLIEFGDLVRFIEQRIRSRKK